MAKKKKKKRILKCKGCKFKTPYGAGMGQHYADYPKHAPRYYKPNSEIKKKKKATVEITREPTPVNLQFCPCCGNSLKYVIQALQMGG